MTTNIIPIKLNNRKTMSSIEIAALTGKRHDHVMRDIESTLSEADIGAPKFGGTYLDVQNKKRKCYNLPKRECDLVISGYSVKYRMAIIDRWIELEGKEIEAPKAMTLIESLKLNLEQAEENEKNKLLIEKQECSIKAKNELIMATNEANIKAGNIKVSAFCKSIDFVEVGQNIMYKWLRDKGYIMKSREPYQQYVNRGYFSWKPTERKINGEFRYTLMITPRGKVILAAKYLKYLED